jgi:hypothetical protein
MSLNKVLNRPLFRQAALKKGYLKPINAKVGQMIGMDVPGGVQNYVQKGGGFYDPVTGRIVGGLPAVQYAPPKPSLGYRIGRDIRGFFSNLRRNPASVLRSGTPGFGTASFIGSAGLYPLVQEGTRKIGVEGPAKPAADLGLAYLLGRTPVGMGAGLSYAGYRGARPFVGRVTDLIKERPLGTTAANPAFMPSVEGVLGQPLEQVSFEEMYRKNPTIARNFMPAEASIDNKAIASGRGAGSKDPSVGYEEFRTALGKGKGDVLTQPENTIVQGGNSYIDVTKLANEAKNNIDDIDDIEGVAGEGRAASPSSKAYVNDEVTGFKDFTDYIKRIGEAKLQNREEDNTIVPDEESLVKDMKPEAPVEEVPTTDTGANQKVVKRAATSQRMISDPLIDRARELYNQMNQGKGMPQSNLVFLANLASGLLTGTTNKKGLGGALEVFGAALGPAVNNYAVMKLKEDEIQRNSMETYLGYALDELKLFNEAAAGTPFEGELGVIQFTDPNGNVKNLKGRQTKGGTMEVATGQLDQNGRMVYAPLSGEALAELGTPTQFLDKKEIDKNTVKIGETLSNRYKTYAVANDVLDILSAKPTAGGPRGAIQLFTTRFGGALQDVFGIGSTTAAEAKALYEQQKAQIETDDTLSDEAKKKILKTFDYDSIYNQAEKRIKSRLGDEEVDADTLEKLAVSETTLVYALANSFKDQDRLTERDVRAAERLVNLFTLTRGSESTRASIKAIAEELERDILRYEYDYRRVGGLEITLDAMRKQNKFRLQEGTQISESILGKFDQMNPDELLEEFNK